MDNLLEYIIIAVFVFSAIKNLFGNKKKPRKKTENSDSIETSMPAKKKIPQDELEILQDFFGVKKDKSYSQDPFDEPSMSKQPEYSNENYNAQGSWNPEAEYSNNQDHKLTDVEERIKTFNEISNVDFDKVVHSKSYLEQIKYDDNSKPTLNRRVLEIKRILKSKKRIKDSFIIADILNKPKAYRRSGNDLFR